MAGIQRRKGIILEGFLGTLRLEAWVERLEGRKSKMCSGTGLRGWQKKRPKESTVAEIYCS